jgi:hypothetical protein
MARRKLQVHLEYRFGPRSVLKPSDRFRVSGGPVYVTENKTVVPMYERGIFVFRRYCEQGASKWVEAYRADGGGLVILSVGKSARSRLIPNLRNRPYRITRKLRNGMAKPAK